MAAVAGNIVRIGKQNNSHNTFKRNILEIKTKKE
jgi:hypothetical protein